MKYFLKTILLALLIGGCSTSNQRNNKPDWRISVLPSSVRLAPTTNAIIDGAKSDQSKGKNLLDKNWIFNGKEVSLYSARGEYISFQLVITNNTDSALKEIDVHPTCSVYYKITEIQSKMEIFRGKSGSIFRIPGVST